MELLSLKRVKAGEDLLKTEAIRILTMRVRVYKLFQWRASCVIAACLLIFSSCTYTPFVVDHYEEIPQRKWSYDFHPKAEIQVSDKSTPYRLYINLRHTEEYRYSNIFMLIQQQPLLPNGLATKPAEVVKRVEITLAEPDGRWLGQQSGNLYGYRELVMDEYFFPDTGLWRLSLEQNMREELLGGVVSVGFRIEALR